MKPSVGRIVHYTNLGDADGRFPPEQQAAIITKAVAVASEEGTRDEDCFLVSLHIFYPAGQFDMQSVPYSENYERGHWSWPPRA